MNCRSDPAEILTEAEQLAQTDPDAAIIVLDRLLCDMDDDSPADPVVAGAIYLQARLVARGGEPTRALELIARARASWRGCGDDMAAIRAGLGEMHVLDDLGRHAAAVDVGSHMLTGLAELEISSGVSDPDSSIAWLRAATLHNIGTALGYTGDHTRALAAYTDAEATWEELGLDHERAMEQLNRGVELTAIGRAAAALDEFDRAAQTLTDVDDQHSLATSIGHRADALAKLGEFTTALQDYERSREIFERLGARTESSRLALQTATTYLELDLVEEALELAGEASRECAEAGLVHDRARAELLSGTANGRAGRHDRAVTRLDAAFDGFGAVGDGLGQAEALLARSEVHARAGRSDDARRDADSALALASVADWPPAAVAAQLALVDVDPGAAGTDGRLDAAQRLAEALPIPDLHYGIAWRRARAHRLAGRRSDARDLLDETEATLEHIRSQFADPALRRSFWAGRSDADRERLRLGLGGDADEQRRAVFDADRASTRTLLEQLGASGSPGQDGDEDESTLELRTVYTELLHAGGQPIGHRRQLLDRIEQLEGRSGVARLRRAVTTEQTPSTPVTFGEPSPTADAAGLGDVIAFEGVDDEVIAYSRCAGVERVHRHLATVAELEEILGELSTQWRRMELPREFVDRHAGQLRAATDDLLARLHALLIAPILGPPSTPPSRLVIVPGVVGAGIPFAALCDDTGVLSDHHAITIAPSIAVAVKLGERAPDGRRSRADGRRVVAYGVGDVSTPAVRDEIAAVGDCYSGARLRLGGEATFGALGDDLGDADVVHLACHGLFREDNPRFSSLQMGDGWYTSDQLATLPFDGQLVVLSACESGRETQRAPGGEPLGLARAFLAAGAGEVVVSGWRVDDRATAEQMATLHRELASGLAADLALRVAQRNVREQRPHPYHWASFARVGGFSRDAEPSDRQRTGRPSVTDSNRIDSNQMKRDTP